MRTDTVQYEFYKCNFLRSDDMAYPIRATEPFKNGK
jgi:hypothetical protein